MGKPAITLALLLAAVSCLSQPKITNYDLKYLFDFKEKKLFGTAVLTIDDLHPKDTLHLLLYRLIKVRSVKDVDGRSLVFRQTVKAFDDWEQLQVNAVQIAPSRLTKKIIIEYDGYIKGYTETGMLYTKDRIDAEFSLLRTDCFAYPVQGVTNWEAYNSVNMNFDYTISVTVPDSLTVANGGALVSSTKGNGVATYTYTNKKPAWRIDIAIGNYRIYKDPHFLIYYFPEDSMRIRSVADNVRKAFDLYSAWFGEKSKEQYAIIEIPDQWGSQTDVTSILQEASAIKDDKRMYELYHEISHIWNLTPLDPSPSRVESEGLAMFLQYLMMEKLHGSTGALDAGAERNFRRLIKMFESDPKKAAIPISEYGPNQLTDLSYPKGMLFFYSLYKKVGEEKFMAAIKEFYTRYGQKGASLKEFSESISATMPGTGQMIHEWLYGTRSLQELMGN